MHQENIVEVFPVRLLALTQIVITLTYCVNNSSIQSLPTELIIDEIASINRGIHKLLINETNIRFGLYYFIHLFINKNYTKLSDLVDYAEKALLKQINKIKTMSTYNI